MDRRAVFFLGAAIVCAALIPLTGEAERWVPIALSIVYFLLSVASWADYRGRRRTDA
jgi:predicted small integral membrane protein